MLQVSAGLVPKEHASGRNRVEMRQHVTSRHSALQWLVQQAETKFLPFAAAVLLPHALAFLAAHFIMSRRSGQAVEVLHEKKEAPKSLSYIIERAGPMWLIHMLGIFSFATGAPSVEYLYLNYFARQSHPDIDCATQMAAAPCAELRRLPQPRQTLEVADASVGSFKAAAATETAIDWNQVSSSSWLDVKEHHKTSLPFDTDCEWAMQMPPTFAAKDFREAVHEARLTSSRDCNL
eukprot:g3484.t1